MKKIIYLCLALCFTAAANAQKITEKDLQGTWKLTSFNTDGIYLDITTGVVTVSEEVKSLLSPEAIDSIKAGMREVMEPLSMWYVYITGSSIRQAVGPEEEQGTFTIADKNDTQYLVTVLDDGTGNEDEIFIEDKLLHIIQADGEEEAEFVFARQ